MSYEIATRTSEAIKTIDKRFNEYRRGRYDSVVYHYGNLFKVIDEVAHEYNLNAEHLALIKGGQDLKKKYLEAL